MSFLVTCEILGLLVNTLTPDDKYFRQKTENLLLPIRTQLSKKQKKFCPVFIKVLNCTLNFEYFEKMSIKA